MCRDPKVEQNTHAGNLRMVKDLSYYLCGKNDKFYPDEFLQTDADSRILKYLSRYELATQKNYVSAVCKMLNIIGEKDTKYSDIQKSLSSQILPKTLIPLTQSEKTGLIEQLNTRIESNFTLFSVKVLCMVLVHRLWDEISITQIARTRIDEDDLKHCYLNLETRQWTIRKQLNARTFNVPIEFAERIKKLYPYMQKQWLAPTRNIGPYVNPGSLSDAFKEAFGKPYTHVVKELEMESTTISEQSIDSKNSTESTASDVSKQSKLGEGIEWSQYNDYKNCRDTSNQLYRSNMQRLMMAVSGTSDKFYPMVFADDATYSKVEEYFDKMGYAVNTRLSYVKGLCKYLEQTPNMPAEIHVRYSKLKDDLKSEQDSGGKAHTDMTFEELVPIIRETMENESRVGGFRIMLAMILSGIEFDLNEDAMTVDKTVEIGVLRPSDLKNTSFFRECSNSWIDIENKRWYIDSELTKNKQTRCIEISDKFIEDIRKVYGRIPAWLLLNSHGERYDKLSSISQMFRKYIGVRFDDIRSAYVTFRHKTADVSTAMELAKKMGHSYTTAITDYNKTAECQEQSSKITTDKGEDNVIPIINGRRKVHIVKKH